MINGKPPKQVGKAEALKYCQDHRDTYIRGFASIDEGLRAYECLESMVASNFVRPEQLSDYGMSDEDLKSDPPHAQ